MKSFKNTSVIGTLMGFLFIAGIALAYVFDHTQAGSGAVTVDTNKEQVQSGTVADAAGLTTVTAPSAATMSAGQTAPAGQSSSGSSSSTTYRNGTYTATVSYRTPENMEQIGVTVSIANDAVTDVTIQNSGYARESQRYQNAFSSGIRQYVVGQSLSSLRLSRVSGASLTTQGFNQALASIKAQASA